MNTCSLAHRMLCLYSSSSFSYIDIDSFIPLTLEITTTSTTHIHQHLIYVLIIYYLSFVIYDICLFILLSHYFVISDH